MSGERQRELVSEDDDTPVTLPDGTVLDGQAAEDYAERVVAEARRRNLIPGGKSLSGGTTTSPTLQVRVPIDLRERLAERAVAEGVSVSKLTRRALERYLAS
jgi:predicted HicB family RNase H-like nuclease